MAFTHLIGVTIIQDKKPRRRSKAGKSDVKDSPRVESKKSFFLTIMCCGCFFSFGTTMAILGPTLIELGHLVGHGLDMMSWLFFTQAAYALLGAIMAGIILDRFNCSRILMLLVFVTLNAVFMAIIPICRTLWVLILTTAAAGYCVGVLDTATNVQLLELHGKKVSPYLQALYFSYGFGAFVSPLIAEPFLSGAPHPEIVAMRREQALPYGGGKHRHRHSRHLNITRGISIADQAYESEVQFAYWIVAIAHIPIVAGLAYLYIQGEWEKYQYKKKKAAQVSTEVNLKEEIGENEDEDRKAHLGLWENPHRFHIICISLWTSFLVFLYDGMQGSYGGYVYTYAVKSSLQMSPAEGAFLTSVFWGSLALGRLISIPVALFTTPAIMLLADLAGTITSSLVMLIFRHSRAVVWFGTSAVGLFMSNVFPSSVALVEQYFDITGTITCMFVVSAAIGEMVIPLVVGKVFDSLGPVSFLVVGTILCFTALGAYLAVLISGKGFSAHKQSVRQEVELTPQDDNGENTIDTLDDTSQETLDKR
ncbi:major facilitator superfamily domain-containing protein 4A isoform X2 [Nematostella vectensis]|uniref:major facilitator superfamily domain-containing protein 4A isoform X2 n=1 Tax=Nematostella vectensis TaxID=45351 RepID=UPI0020778482|nr:major facilitator superfamily domain-containing protein 4A isoform X2 [Nematostella vectensis]